MSHQQNTVRIERTSDDYERQKKQITAWLDEHDLADSFGAYRGQLANLRTLFYGVFDNLQDTLRDLTATSTTADVYQKCRQVDQCLVWVDQVWRFYASKFDQRNDSSLSATLLAADEVTWSCYAGFFDSVKAGPKRAPPLPYIEPLYSPKANPRDQLDILKNTIISGKFFQRVLKELPIPIIGLPQACKEAPWWLIFIGHEVGHHVQHDLGLVDAFADCLSRAVDPNRSSKQAEQWRAWGQEVFADAFSVYSLGTPAVRGITELELGQAQSMLESKTQYPPATVRLALLRDLALALDMDASSELLGHNPDELTSDTDPNLSHDDRSLRQEARAHLNLVPTIVQAIREYEVAGSGLIFAKLWAFYEPHFKPGAAVEQCRSQLQGTQALHLSRTLDGPRWAASAGLMAWAGTGNEADKAKRGPARRALAPRLLQAIENSSEGHTWAAPTAPSAANRKRGQELLQNLMQATPEDLGL